MVKLEGGDEKDAYSILFYSILFYSILFYSILFVTNIYAQTPEIDAQATEETFQEANRDNAGWFFYSSLKDGKAETIKKTVLKMKADVAVGKYDKQALRKIKRNSKVLIHVARTLIQEGKYSDPYTEEDRKKDEELFAKIQEASKEVEFKIDERTLPKEEVYNEKKKDLIEATYRLQKVVKKKLHHPKKEIDPKLLKDEDNRDLMLQYLDDLSSGRKPPRGKK